MSYDLLVLLVFLVLSLAAVLYIQLLFLTIDELVQVFLHLIVQVLAELVFLLDLLDVVTHLLSLFLDVAQGTVELHYFDVALIDGLAVTLHCVLQLFFFLLQVLYFLFVFPLLVQQFLNVVFLLEVSVLFLLFELLQCPQALVHLVQRRGQSQVFIKKLRLFQLVLFRLQFEPLDLGPENIHVALPEVVSQAIFLSLDLLEGGVEHLYLLVDAFFVFFYCGGQLLQLIF